VDGAVIPITTRPWVVGCVEYASAFFGFDDTWFRRSIPRRSLLRLLSGQKCRKILTQSEAALSSIRVGYGRDFAAIESKCAVLPPAIPSKYLLRTPPKREEDGKVRILFVGNHFFDKGGRELFYTFRRLRKKFDVELVLVTSVPKHHEHYFASFSKTVAAEPGVRLLSKVPKDVLWKEYYAKSDVFCMPSYMDTFGYVALEAMANRLPVVTTDMFALQEIVKDGETGLKVHAPIASFERDRPRTPESLRRYREAVLDESLFTSVVDDLEIALTRLIEDGSVRRRMGESAYREVEHGRFSVPYRNGRLMDHYREALG
jgi:glycosyltransferase involved in cell wall biosynthesis